MILSTKEILRRLGSGESIASVCAEAGITRAEFDGWWKTETAARVPAAVGKRRGGVREPAHIERDRWGIPAIHAGNDEDLFFGFGYAMAQDRLFQLDYLRRRGAGRMAEVFGAKSTDLDLLNRVPGFQNVFELDLLARTVGIRRIAEFEWTVLPEETRRVLTAFSHGINAVIDETRERPPIEFDLLDYRPERWSPIDCLTVEGEFRWYLTGRFPIIVMPELAKRALGNGPLYQAYVRPEFDDECILPKGSYRHDRVGAQPVGAAAGDPQGAEGSNNWVIAGRMSRTGKPMVASDPHIAFEAVSCWYEVRLCGGSFRTVGMAYVGMPAVMFGRNERVAWGCTNNICSQRDLYQEKTDPNHPNCFLQDGRWEPARELEEVIRVKGGEPVRKTIRFSRNGPIVDEVLPPAARQTGPVALKWLGAHQGGWLTALLGIDRAKSSDEFREALRPWHVPTFSVVYADVEGHIGFQAVGRVPIRKCAERGYRAGWDPTHQWDGLIPFDGMPSLIDPERGWAATANNRPAAEDFPYPLSGTWSDGCRALRIRQMIEGQTSFGRDDFVAMQQDAMSMRAQRCLPGLLRVLEKTSVARLQEATKQLKAWDYRVEPDRGGAAIWEVFFSYWTKAVIQERFTGALGDLLAGGATALAAELLLEDSHGWFQAGKREQTLLATLTSALDHLTAQCGPSMAQWTWGQLHTLPLRHILSGRGDLAQLLDHGGIPIKGDSSTVCNTGIGPRFEAKSGAGYRLIAELSASPPGLWSVDGQSQSGHPGSVHYRDQLEGWKAGEYHWLAVEKESRPGTAGLLLEP